MRVAFQLGSRLDGGMARYAQELGAALAARDDVTLVPIGSRAVLDALHERLGRPVDRIEVPSRQLTEAGVMRFRLGRLARGRADVLHGTKHLLPRSCALPTVLTVHDVLPLDQPDAYTFAKRVLLPRQYRSSIRAADALVMVSHTTGDRLAQRMPEVMARATVIPTVPPAAVTAAVAVPVPDAPAAFGLYVGDLSPRKNVGFLLDVWEDVHRRSGRPLLLVGPDGWKAQPVLAQLPDLETRGVVRRLGFVDNGALRWLYEHASVVVLPSAYEGTGLPVVEALALGAPVVASDEPALVEFGRGAAVHLALSDRQRWVDTLAELVVDQTRRSHPAMVVGDPEGWADMQIAVYRRVLNRAHDAAG